MRKKGGFPAHVVGNPTTRDHESNRLDLPAVDIETAAWWELRGEEVARSDVTEVYGTRLLILY